MLGKSVEKLFKHSCHSKTFLDNHLFCLQMVDPWDHVQPVGGLWHHWECCQHRHPLFKVQVVILCSRYKSVSSVQSKGRHPLFKVQVVILCSRYMSSSSVQDTGRHPLFKIKVVILCSRYRSSSSVQGTCRHPLFKVQVVILCSK